MDETNKKFSEFLNKARVIESFKKGHTVSQSEMARLIGIPQGSLSQYENGTRLPNEENKYKLGNYFGPEVYEILGGPVMMPDDPLLRRVAHVWTKLNPDMQKRIVNKVEDAVLEWDEQVSRLAGDVKR